MLKMNMNKLLCYVITIALFSIPWILEMQSMLLKTSVEGDSITLRQGGLRLF